MESTLITEGDDIAIRQQLIAFYHDRPEVGARIAWLKHIKWLIANQPDSPLLASESTQMNPADFKPPLEPELQFLIADWRRAVDAHPDDERVLENAVRCLNKVEYSATADFLKRLRKLEPTNPQWVYLLATLYEGALTKQEHAPQAYADLSGSSDLAVIGITGRDLFSMGKSGKAEPLAQFGATLLRKAQSLDPLNPHWSESEAAAPWIPAEKDLWPYGKVPEMSVPEGAIRVSAATQAAKRIQPNPGTAGKTTLPLEALIGKDGRVQALHASTGSASVIPAAMNIARRWTYQPTLIDGQPVEVVTQIEVPVATPKPAAGATAASKAPSNFVPPVALTKVEPEYTPEAHAAKFSGSVLVSLIVDEQGLPKNIKVVRSAGMGLDEKAVEAVAKWTFKPATKDGKPIAVPANVEVSFKSR